MHVLMSEVMCGYTKVREYRVTTGNEADLLEHYRPGSTWVPLFRRAPSGQRDRLD